MGTLKNSILSFIIVLISLSCSNYKKVNNFNNKTNAWKKDSLGCLNIRNKQLSEYIIIKNNLYGKTSRKFYKNFGKPNNTKETNKGFIVEYYFNSSCHEIIDNDERDYCTAQYYFYDNKFNRVLYRCF